MLSYSLYHRQYDDHTEGYIRSTDSLKVDGRWTVIRQTVRT